MREEMNLKKLEKDDARDEWSRTDSLHKRGILSKLERKKRFEKRKHN